MRRFQEGQRLAGARDHAEENADFGVPQDNELRADLVGYTPTTVPGAQTIGTLELAHLLPELKPIVLDCAGPSWGRSIPGAISLLDSGVGGGLSDGTQDRLRAKMRQLTNGELSLPIVVAGWNSEGFDGRNLALRLVALGYRQIYWYRGGREAWEVAGLPETDFNKQDW